MSEKSNIWNYYLEIDENTAECVICKKFVNTKDGNKALDKHLNEFHEDQALLQDSEDAITSAYVPKQRKCRNPILWEYFTKVSREFADCNLCFKRLCYRSTTANLGRHLYHQHDVDLLNFSKRIEHDTENNDQRCKRRQTRKRRYIEVFDDEAPSKSSDEEETRVVTNVSEFFDLEDGISKCMVCDQRTENSIEDFQHHISHQHPELLPNKEPNTEIVLVKEEPRIPRPRLDSFSVSQSQYDAIEAELQEGQEDELTHFSRYLTSLLRTLPKKVQAKLQIDLLKTVMEAKMAADSDREERKSLNPLDK